MTRGRADILPDTGRFTYLRRIVNERYGGNIWWQYQSGSASLGRVTAYTTQDAD